MSKFQSLGHLRQDGVFEAIDFTQDCTYDQSVTNVGGTYFPAMLTLTIAREWQWTIAVRNPSPSAGTTYICADMTLQMKGSQCAMFPCAWGVFEEMGRQSRLCV